MKEFWSRNQERAGPGDGESQNEVASDGMKLEEGYCRRSDFTAVPNFKLAHLWPDFRSLSKFRDRSLTHNRQPAQNVSAES
jgi:hypothetical protein